MNNEKSGMGSNIWTSAADGDLDRVKFLVESGVSVNAADELGYTPVQAASSWGRVDVLKWLVDNGGDVTDGDEDGDTALHVAETADVADYLMSKGASPEMKNNMGLTPLDAAVEEENNDLCAFYEGRGFVLPTDTSSPETRDNMVSTPLDVVVEE